MKTLIIVLLALIGQSSANANLGLTIHATEIGVGKFHRKDNQVHVYLNGNAWTPYILPEGQLKTPLVVENKDGSYTIFFSHLDELLTTIESISTEKKTLVSTLNLHGHGLPGQMWFPRDAQALQSIQCSQWRESANAPDDDNYSQYYSAIPKNEIQQIRQISNQSGYHAPCTTGLKDWQLIAIKHPALKSALADELQVHFLSCVVGLGKMGDAFTRGIASLLLKTDQGRIQTSMAFGLGDWSMVEGMGFWDYQNDIQLNRDNENYPVHREDREEMQKGSVRIAGLLNQKIVSSIMPSQDFMFTDDRAPGTLSDDPHLEAPFMDAKMNVTEVRIPGTGVHVKIGQ
ncbi:MAG: hypothetical protein H7333_03430 [Bdellovibrionales bacterium]|nr:hypothetical protein [Oligoflexia bacterium]